MRPARPRPRVRSAAWLLAGALCVACASDPGGTPLEDQTPAAVDARPPELHAAPPLGKPRPKVIPGDVLRRAAEADEG